MLRQLQALDVDVKHERERARTAAASPQLPATRAGARRGWERDMQKQWAQEALVRPPARLARDGREPRVAARSHRHPIPNAFGRDVGEYQLRLEEGAVQAWGALYEPGERGLSIGEKENKHSVCRPYPQHWRPSRETNTHERTLDDAEPAAGSYPSPSPSPSPNPNPNPNPHRGRLRQARGRRGAGGGPPLPDGLGLGVMVRGRGRG